MLLTHGTLEILVSLIMGAPLVAGSFGFWLTQYSLTAESLFSLGAMLLLIANGPAGFPLRFTFGLNFCLVSLGIYFLLLTNLIAVFSVWYVDNLENRDQEPSSARALRHFSSLLSIFQFALLLVPVINDLFFLWLIIELTTIILVLLLLLGSAPHTVEAKWKYLSTTIPGMILTFLAMILLASNLPANKVFRWSELLQIARELGPRLNSLVFESSLLAMGRRRAWLLSVLGFQMCLMRLLFRSVRYSRGGLNIALFVLICWTNVTNSTLGSQTFTSSQFMALGLLSIMVATMVISKTNKFKRVLAYHSLHHIRINAFGLGIWAPLVIVRALLDILNQGLAKGSTFLTFGTIQHSIASVRKEEAAVRSTRAWYRRD